MGTLGVGEMVTIFIVALVLFGPKKLPELGRTIGKAITEFRRASNELKSTFEREMHNLERETGSMSDITRSLDQDVRSQSEYESHSYYDSSNYLTEPHESTATIPSTVSASEVPGADLHADSNGHADTNGVPLLTAPEGTVPRADEPQNLESQQHEPAAETPQHS